MGTTGKSPHDAIVADTFGQAEHARGLVAALLPEEALACLDVDRLEPTPDHLVDEKLRGLETDLLFRVPTRDGTPAFLFILLEHQSTADPLMPFRLLKYMVRIWDKHLRETGATMLPPIVPVVLSHAAGGWSAARSLAELVEGPEELVRALGPMLPDFEPVIEDLTARTDEELMGMKMTALGRMVVLLLKHAREGRLAERLGRWAEVLTEVVASSGPEALVRVLMYAIECDEELTLEDLGAIEAIALASEGEVLMTLAERLREEGRQEARREAAAREARLREEARLEGRRSVVAKLLTLRFGPLEAEDEARLGRATEAELEAVAEAVLSAGTVGEALSPIR